MCVGGWTGALMPIFYCLQKFRIWGHIRGGGTGEEARMPNRRNAERAECRILAVVIKQTKSCISHLLSLCGASVYSQYYKIRLHILCRVGSLTVDPIVA